MSAFTYTAVDSSGKKKTGEIEAADQQSAVSALTKDGKFVLEITAGKSKTATEQASVGGSSRITKSDLALFTRRLADLSGAGLPLDRVLKVVSEQSESRALAVIIEHALEDVRGGVPVSGALAKYPKYFPPIFTETLKAGEASGQFSQVAERLADMQEKDVARRSAIVSALIYPGVLSATAGLVIIFLLTYVVPKLAGVFKDMGDKLPAPTKALLALTGFLTQNGTFLIIALIGAAIGWKVWTGTEAGAHFRDSLLLRLPLVGKTTQKAVVSRFSRVLGTLVYGGVPILEALRLSGLAAGNQVFKASADEVEEGVRTGRSIHEAMSETNVFPPVLTHMVAIGEETGDLPRMLGRVSESLDFEVDTSLRRLVALAEPIIVLSMGVIVGFVVLSVMLPIFEAQNLVK